MTFFIYYCMLPEDQLPLWIVFCAPTFALAFIFQINPRKPAIAKSTAG
jgi:hypothetical protein